MIFTGSNIDRELPNGLNGLLLDPLQMSVRMAYLC